jgi:hypothetical protein
MSYFKFSSKYPLKQSGVPGDGGDPDGLPDGK